MAGMLRTDPYRNAGAPGIACSVKAMLRMITDCVYTAKKKISALPGVRCLKLPLQLLDDLIGESMFDVQQATFIMDAWKGNSLLQ